MTGVLTRIRHRSARRRNEPPAVPTVAQLQLQHTELRGVTPLAVGANSAEPPQARTARPYRELANSPFPICPALRCLGREALVDMVMANQDNLGAVLVERLPGRTEPRFPAVFAGTEQRVMPVGKHTALVRSGQFPAEPGQLRRP